MALEGVKGTRLDQIWQSGDRQPAFRVCIWNPRFATTQDVVLERWEGHRYDISDFVERISLSNTQVFEASDDAVSSRAQLTIVREDFPGLDVGGANCPVVPDLFRDGTPIRIYEGDRRISRDDWVPVFTGTVRGYPGGHVASRGEKKTIRIQAFGRAQAYQKQRIVGINFKFNTDLGDMAVDTAMQELALEREEIRFGHFDLKTKQRSNALADIGKMQGLFEIMNHVGRKPYFDAFGLLVAHDTRFHKPPALSYILSAVIKSVVRVQSLRSIVNSVEVIGLDRNLSKVLNRTQPLNDITASVGYWDSSFRELIFFSKDHARRAQDTFREDIHSGTSSFLGGGSTWTQFDEFHGQLVIDTGFAPWVLGLIALVWALLSYIEYDLDATISELNSKTIVDVGAIDVLISLRSITQFLKAITQLTAMFIMTIMGRWRTRIWGKPFEYVYKELRSIAVLKDVPVADVVEKSVVLHWLHNITLTDARAKELLQRELAKSHAYEIQMLSNAILEVDDVIDIQDPRLDIGEIWSFYITSIKRELTRGPLPGTMSVRAWLIKKEKA